MAHGGSLHIRGETTVLHILTDCDLDNVDISSSILLSIVDIGSFFMFNVVIGVLNFFLSFFLDGGLSSHISPSVNVWRTESVYNLLLNKQFNYINTTGAISGARTAYPSGAPPILVGYLLLDL